MLEKGLHRMIIYSSSINYNDYGRLENHLQWGKEHHKGDDVA